MVPPGRATSRSPSVQVGSRRSRPSCGSARSRSRARFSGPKAGARSTSATRPATRSGGVDEMTFAGLRQLLPRGGSLPDAEWHRRHRVIVALLGFAMLAVAAYALALRGADALRYLPEVFAMLVFALLSSSLVESRM